MNFNELYRKIADIDKQTAADIVEECGMGPMTSPMSSPMPQQDNVSMNVNMSGSGAGGIRDLMAILKNIEDHGEHGEQEIMPGIDSVSIGSSDGMDDMGSDGSDELAQMLKLTGQDDGGSDDGMSNKNMLPGNDSGTDGPALDDEPMDGPEEEPKDKPEDESFANEPDQNYNDVGAVTTDAGGGLNGSKQQIKQGSTAGNNPLPESVKRRLEAKYQQYR
jgi:hypothetical protein